MKLRHKFSSLTSALLVASVFSGVTSMTHAALPQSATAIDIPAQHLRLSEQWDKIFPQSAKVEHRKVIFQNRYGITLAADLYLPKGASGKLAAIAVSGPFGAVKEQSSGLYAQTLAERGFVTLAFDPSFSGESSGLPRNQASPDINTEDFSAAIDYLSTRDFVDAERIGILGICGWGGMALNAAAMDTRIKAVATSVMYDMSRAMGHGVGEGKDRYSVADRKAVLKFLNAQRTQDFKNGTYAQANHDLYVDENGQVTRAGRTLPEVLPQNPHPILKEFFDFYRTERGFHPRAINSTSAWNATMPLSFMNMPLLSYAAEVDIPVLVVTGEKAHSRYFAEDAFKAMGSRHKELVIVPGANHVDLYDNEAGKIPYDKFSDFFTQNLK
ncbi:hypothetical protein EDC45_1787 [Mesocricetibacter intestinalis]|uniref:Xaa-Pro dipeptidyl-peptidase-like domain-containing protein n=1 Tax=Mesocricetibacter intestinalis TaxID=1521930 RepID=A0A4R6VAL3_9PAST|nr:alpha/beta hydrolase [Mesocricetibacter intestinalis]TDQ56828.1 hypothetical protein EDC45_1787 [Mesocricetibacter intestinalis]